MDRNLLNEPVGFGVGYRGGLDPRRDGVLLIGHGTRDQTGTDEFRQLEESLARKLDPLPVAGALLEFQRPTIREAWQRLLASGVQRIRVAPLLLFAAGHARSDIPDVLAECAAESRPVRFEQCGPLSRAPSIVDLLASRAAEACGEPFVGDAALVTVGRGSFDPCATADMQLLGEIVARRLGVVRHRVGFYAMAEPKLPEVLDAMALTDGVRKVVVQPHLLFHGRLYQSIVGQVRDAAARHPHIRFITGDYLGPHESVVRAIVRRIESPGRIAEKAA